MILKRKNVERVVVSEIAANKLISEGFRPIDSVETEQAPEGEVTDIEKMTVPALKALAKENGIEGAKSLNKEELQAVLKDVV